MLVLSRQRDETILIGDTIEVMVAPELRPVPDWSGYFASSDGHISSQKTSRVLRKLSPSRGGGANRDYLYVTLCRPGEKKRLGVHQIVAATFIALPENPTGKPLVVRHLDNNPNNNAFSNLAWGTHAENLADRLAAGTMTHGTRNGQARISESDVIEIRRRRALGERCVDIAAQTGLSPQAVHKIGSGQRWKHVTGPVAPRQCQPRKVGEAC